MANLAAVYLDWEKGGIATVHCRRCHQAIGRVQVKPPLEDPAAWEAEVQGELEVLAAEHSAMCPVPVAVAVGGPAQ